MADQQRCRIVDSDSDDFLVSGNEGEVNVAASALPTGAATEATLANVSTEAKQDALITDITSTPGIVLQDDGGSPFGMKLAAGKPRLSSTGYGTDVVEGNISGHAAQTVSGFAVSNGATLRDLWGGVLDEAPVLGAAIAMEVVSSSIQDDTAGTGIDEVEIHYLDTNGDAQEETITMDGQTPVAMGENALHIQSVHATAAGSGASAPFLADGDIDVRAVAGGVIYARIPAGQVISPRFVYQVPTGKTGYFQDWIGTVLALNASATGLLEIVANQDPESKAVLPVGMWVPYFEFVGGSAGASTSGSVEFPLDFAAGVTVKARVKRLDGAGNARGFLLGRGWIE